MSELDFSRLFSAPSPALANLSPIPVINPAIGGSLDFKPLSAVAAVSSHPELIAAGIGQGISDIGKGFSAAIIERRKEKREEQKAAEEAKLQDLKFQREDLKDARNYALDKAKFGLDQQRLGVEQQRADMYGKALELRKKGSIPNYESYFDKNDTTPSTNEDGVSFFPQPGIDMPEVPAVDDNISVDQQNLGAMPTQDDQRFASLSNLGSLPDMFKTASLNQLPPTAPSPGLPYSLQGGVPKPLSNVQMPDMRSLPSTGGFTPSPIPVYESKKPATTPQTITKSPIISFPVTDTKGNIVGTSYYDKESKKLIPGSYVNETKPTGPGVLSDVTTPEGFRPKSMTINAKGEKSYTYEPKTSELTQAQATSLGRLGDDWKADPFIKNANEAIASQGVIEGSLAQRNGFGDIAAINALQRMIDPGVAVREGDVKLIQEAIPRLQRMGLKAKNWFIGDQLVEPVRQQMSALASNLVDQRSAAANENSVPRFKEISKKESLDFGLVGRDFQVKSKKLQPEYKAAQKEFDSLIAEIDSATDKNSPAILAKKQRATDLFLRLK